MAATDSPPDGIEITEVDVIPTLLAEKMLVQLACATAPSMKSSQAPKDNSPPMCPEGDESDKT